MAADDEKDVDARIAALEHRPAARRELRVIQDNGDNRHGAQAINLWPVSYFHAIGFADNFKQILRGTGVIAAPETGNWRPRPCR